VSGINRLVNVLAEGEGTEETTGEHVSGSVRVDNLVVGELGDGVRLWVGVGRLEVGGGVRRGRRRDEGRLGTLGDNDETGFG